MAMTVLPFGTSTPGGFVAPPGVSHVQLIAWGGGGGGGAGTYGVQRDSVAPGGGGGGAAQKDVTLVAVEAGERYDVVIGAGGEGAPTHIDGAAVQGVHGKPGGDTLFVRSRDGVVLARFRGAGGGTSAFYGEPATPGRQLLTCGGTPVGGDWGPHFAHSDEGGNVPGPLPPGTGGFGIANEIALSRLVPASPSVQGFTGGRHGACGASDNSPAQQTLFGGGGGGGGAAGPGGDGARGGAGGHWGRFDSEGFGEGGWSADDGSGAGGGGGGTGGSLDRSVLQGIPVGTAVSVPGPGGSGGSGSLTIAYVA